ncbi:LamG domain-containing protein [Actinoallomurus iriomotensis]|uniref:LamG-like jellyroll fold domain-containing protein n=1 Tax=Actinoallomurus iriomotensis TaxID=478107 RepID=A0A9W6RQL2_9ACTN|nr:LamG domain-containing protein [Actinoallomurus iriomotensis]GLY80044.1 hypothetical protein Airi01_083110 [Actinoallomurus iriomotensis]
MSLTPQPGFSLVDGQTFRWRVTLVDTAYSGTPSGWCYYRVDKSAPETAPAVTSSDLQDSSTGEPNDVIGRAVTFAVAPNGATGITHYEYGWDSDAAATGATAPSVAADADGKATLTLTVPYTQDITYRLYVFSFDAANNRSVSPGVFEFKLASAAGPVGQWTLDETSGPDLADSAGDDTATLTGGTPGVAGRVDQALRLTGNGDHATSRAAVVHTDKSYTVSVWARLTDDSHYSTAVSQSGTNFSGFQIYYSPNTKKWTFNRRVSDASDAANTLVQADTTATLNVWTHLTAVYDAPAQRLSFYVNGARQASSPSFTTPWDATGPLEIGRVKTSGAWGTRLPELFPLFGLAERLPVIGLHALPYKNAWP